MSGAVPTLPASLACPVPGKPQFGTGCAYMVAENGANAEITPGLVPNFYGWSITDQYRPTDKWLLNLGVRLDTFNFAGGNQLVPPLGGGGPEARAFWWTAFNLDNCQNTKTGAVFPNPSPGKLCPAGSISTYLQNQTNQNFTFNIYQPRFAGTYTADPNNVIRFSAGRYTEAGNTAFEQYGTWQEDSADFIGPTFLQYGRNTPGLSRPAANLDQLRPLVGAPPQRYRLVMEGDAVLAPDARPDSGVLPQCQGRLRFGSQRGRPAQRRRRVAGAKGRLLAQRSLGLALVCIHQRVYQVRAGKPSTAEPCSRASTRDSAVQRVHGSLRASPNQSKLRHHVKRR